jgi:hypothetical protein
LHLNETHNTFFRRFAAGVLYFVVRDTPPPEGRGKLTTDFSTVSRRVVKNLAKKEENLPPKRKLALFFWPVSCYNRLRAVLAL